MPYDRTQSVAEFNKAVEFGLYRARVERSHAFLDALSALLPVRRRGT